MAKLRQLGRSNRLGMFVITGIVMILLVGMLMQSSKLRVQNAIYEAQKEELDQKIKDEEIRAVEIEKLAEYIDSDEYIEKIARDKLGLVYPDEVIFKAEG